MKRIIFSPLLAFLLIWMGCAPTQVKPIPEVVLPPFEESLETAQEALKILEASELAFEEIQEYTSIYLKEERLDTGKLRPQETVLVKFRKPHQIYMKWIKEPNKDMELIYPVRDNKLLVEPGGILDWITPKMYLNPTNNLAMMRNRHPVTEANIGYLVRRYTQDFRKALEKKELRVLLEEGSSFMGRSANRLEVYLHEEGYYCYRSIVYFDKENHFPLHVEFYDKENKLFERVSFTQLNLNPGLKDIDFDEENPEYDF